MVMPVGSWYMLLVACFTSVQLKVKTSDSRLLGCLIRIWKRKVCFDFGFEYSGSFRSESFHRKNLANKLCTEM